MMTPNYDDIQPSSGPLFTRKFLVKVDEYTGISEIIEQCTARITMYRRYDEPVVYPGVRFFRDTKGIEAAGLYDKHP